MSTNTPSSPGLDYQNKKILAPMVRIGTLPTRLLALDYGADIVYTEEIIDFKMLQCRRVDNALLGTTDYVLGDGTVVFRTCPREKPYVVFQMGTSNAKRALKVAKMIENDVAAIDINMGCPKAFSIHAGMGAALLSQPEKIKEILTTLVNGLSIPVTCKIRILPTIEETLDLCKLIEETGVKAMGVHGRMIHERPKDGNHNDVIKRVAETMTIPVIANGGSKDHIKTYEDIEVFRRATGAASVMIARAAEWNTSVFRKEGMLPIQDVIKAYLKYAIDYDNGFTNMKYCIQQMLHDQLATELGEKLLGTQLVREICDLWDMGSYLTEVEKLRATKAAELSEKQLLDDSYLGKVRKRKLEDGTEFVEMPFKYVRNEYPDKSSPKLILYEHCMKNRIKLAEYQTEQRDSDKCFHSTVVFQNNKYTTPFWEKSKKFTEQAAAVVCLRSLGIHDGRKDMNSDSGAVLNHSVKPTCPNHSVNKLDNINQHRDKGLSLNIKNQTDNQASAEAPVSNSDDKPIS